MWELAKTAVRQSALCYCIDYAVPVGFVVSLYSWLDLPLSYAYWFEPGFVESNLHLFHIPFVLIHADINCVAKFMLDQHVHTTHLQGTNSWYQLKGDLSRSGIAQC